MASGQTLKHRYDVQPYFRGTIDATARRSIGKGFIVAGRVFGGVVQGEDVVAAAALALDHATKDSGPIPCRSIGARSALDGAPEIRLNIIPVLRSDPTLLGSTLLLHPAEMRPRPAAVVGWMGMCTKPTIPAHCNKRLD